MAFIFTVAGIKNSGKTSLCLLLLEYLKEADAKVAYVKHSHEKVLSSCHTDTGKALLYDIPVLYWGVDGYRYEKAGDLPLEKIQYNIEPDLDILLIEGGKSFSYPKVWIGEPEDCPSDILGVVAFYSLNSKREKETKCSRQIFYVGEEKFLAEYILSLSRKANPNKLTLTVEGEYIYLKPFVAEFIEGGIKGMLSSLKKIGKLNGNIEIFIKKDKRK